LWISGKNKSFHPLNRPLSRPVPLHEVDKIERMLGHHGKDIFRIGDDRTYQNRIELRVLHLAINLRGVVRIIADAIY
jgi:hypothetical protein